MANVNPAPLLRVGATPAHGAAVPSRSAPGAFGEVLRGQAPTVRFSSHAMQRIEHRGIDVSAPALHRLQSGVARAENKGARESVVFVNGTAFVVSVSNKTVITAVDSAHMRDFVFTNIDSAVIA